MFPFLLFVQVATAPLDTAPLDTATYSSAALRTIVSEAARLNRNVPPALGRYRADVESEMSVGLREAGGTEMALAVEQIASRVTWDRTGEFTHRVIGYNTPTMGMAGPIGLFRTSWLVPSLYGNRLTLFWGTRDSTRSAKRDSSRKARRDTTTRTLAVHPLATDRERFYRFSGGDTIEVLRIDDRDIRIVRVDVQPREDLPALAVVFGGELDLDAERKQIVRMRGTFYLVGGPPPGAAAVVARAVGRQLLEGIGFFELVNAEIDKEFWLPQYQRCELLIAGVMLGDMKEIVRIVSQFRNVTISPPDSAWLASGSDSLRARPRPITFASRDSIGAFDDWQRPLGAATSSVSADDYTDIGPSRWRADGPPFVALQGERASDVVRFNRIEGLFTGVGVAAKFRDAAPGVTLRASAGYAWSEETVRGHASAEFKRDAWTYALRGGRSLDITNDFRAAFDSGSTIGALLGIDDYDYVDRYTGGVSVVHAPKRGMMARVELGWADDRAVTRHAMHGMSGDPFLRNRGVDEGRYLRSGFTLQWHQNAMALLSAWPGVGASLSYVRGDGDLNFQRVEMRLSARRYAGPWTFSSTIAAGAIFGAPPAQQLFEIGGEHGLPGYEYKEFAGDRAAVVNGFAMYRLGILTSPVAIVPETRFWPRTVLPAIAPALRIVVSGGWAGASSDATRDAIARLGPRDPIAPDDVAPYAPASAPTGNPRVSVGGGVVFFGGIVGISVARAIDHHALWKVQTRF